MQQPAWNRFPQNVLIPIDQFDHPPHGFFSRVRDIPLCFQHRLLRLSDVLDSNGANHQFADTAGEVAGSFCVKGAGGGCSQANQPPRGESNRSVFFIASRSGLSRRVVAMHGEMIWVWPETWPEIWVRVSEHEAAPPDLFCELYRELAPALRESPSIEELAEVIDNPGLSREAFENISSASFAGEKQLVGFLETAHSILEDLGGDPLANHYFLLLDAFIEKFSLRYDLRRPCVLCPTLPGVFASLIRNLRVVTGQDI
jgi:hypothetical protein